jgi:hypothetical protein
MVKSADAIEKSFYFTKLHQTSKSIRGSSKEEFFLSLHTRLDLKTNFETGKRNYFPRQF